MNRFGIIFLFAINLLHADVIEPGTHPVDKCVRFDNAENVPGTTFIAHIEAVSGEAPSYVIKNGQCLQKGYKFNTLSIYALPTSEIEGTGIEKIDVSKKTPVITEFYNDSFANFMVYGISLSDEFQLEAENLTYEFAENGQGSFFIQLIRIMEKDKGSLEWKEKPLPTPIPTCETLGGVCTYNDELPECDETGCPSGCGTGKYGIEGKCPQTEKRYATCCILAIPFQPDEPALPDEPTDIKAITEIPTSAPIRNVSESSDLFGGFTSVLSDFFRQITCFYGRLFGGTC